MAGFDTSGKRLLSEHQFSELCRAISQEIAEQKDRVGVEFLDIDAIQRLEATGHRFVYRLVLSKTISIHPDQVLTFHVRKPRQQITAVVLQSDDEGLVVMTQGPLPEDATVLQYTFDPSFIFVALRDFIEARLLAPPPLALHLADKKTPEPASPVASPDRPVASTRALDDSQEAAVRAMLSQPMHFLWGPPGTGKTHTVGYAVRECLRARRSVLVVTVSNAAVDAACKAILKHVPDAASQRVLRLGASLDPVVSTITAAGLLEHDQPHSARRARASRERLQALTAASCTSGSVGFGTSADSMRREVEGFDESVREKERQLIAESPVVACTLAKLVLDHELGERRFDTVIVDEASMVPIAFALAAALMASHHLIFAGDWQQLPPICQSNRSPALEWFGRNVYTWLGIEDGYKRGRDLPQVSFLAQQYRMVPTIGTFVSELSYEGRLRNCRSGFDGPFQGAHPIFIPVDSFLPFSYYAVTEQSYFHPGIVPIIHGLSSFTHPGEMLLLTPFRPQRSLLSAISLDIKDRDPRFRMTASTIHRAQGSECRAVVVDLTAHDAARPVSFFRDPQSEKLLNVALSRARDELLVIGNTKVLDGLATSCRFWRLFREQLGKQVDVMELEEVFESLQQHPTLAEAFLPCGDRSQPAFYSHGASCEPVDEYARLLKRATATRKLLVASEDCDLEMCGDAIVRCDSGNRKLPRMLAVGGTLCVPCNEGWLLSSSPNACRVLWRLAFAHLAEDEANPTQASRFFCPECESGNLVLKNFKAEGWYLACNNWQTHHCYYRRRLSLYEAKLKVRLTNMRCPMGHPMTVRTSSNGFFLGCENYPAHEYSESLSILADT